MAPIKTTFRIYWTDSSGFGTKTGMLGVSFPSREHAEDFARNWSDGMLLTPGFTYRVMREGVLNRGGKPLRGGDASPTHATPPDIASYTHWHTQAQEARAMLKRMTKERKRVRQERNEACARASDATRMLCEAVGAGDFDWNIGQAATLATEVIADLKLTCDRDNARIIAATKTLAAALEGTDHLGLDLEWAVDLVVEALGDLTRQRNAAETVLRERTKERDEADGAVAPTAEWRHPSRDRQDADAELRHADAEIERLAVERDAWKTKHDILALVSKVAIASAEIDRKEALASVSQQEIDFVARASDAIELHTGERKRLRAELKDALAGREREYARAEDAEERVRGADALLAGIVWKWCDYAVRHTMVVKPCSRCWCPTHSEGGVCGACALDADPSGCG